MRREARESARDIYRVDAHVVHLDVRESIADAAFTALVARFRDQNQNAPAIRRPGVQHAYGIDHSIDQPAAGAASRDLLHSALDLVRIRCEFLHHAETMTEPQHD